MSGRTLLAVALLLASVVGAGCFGPEEDPSTEVQEEEGTTPGEDTVEAGGQPTGEPVNDTAIAEGNTTAPDEGGNETEENGEG